MSSENISFYIPTPEIFSFQECLHFLDRGYDDCLYSIEGDWVVRPLRINGNDVLIQVGESDQQLDVHILRGPSTEEVRQVIKRFVSEWFDLGRNLAPFYRRLQKSQQLRWMADHFHGLRLMGIPDLFEALCWCVIGQQINLTFAHKLKRKLVETYGTSLSYEETPFYLFPEPAILASLNVEDLKELQFSRQKAEYIIGIATEFANGALSKELVSNHESSQLMLKRLKEIRGVGDWTANYVLMKSLQKMDCITYGDTGLHSAVSTILGLDRKPTREEVEHVFGPFTGWESYLVIYLWRSLS